MQSLKHCKNLFSVVFNFAKQAVGLFLAENILQYFSYSNLPTSENAARGKDGKTVKLKSPSHAQYLWNRDVEFEREEALVLGIGICVKIWPRYKHLKNPCGCLLECDV